MIGDNYLHLQKWRTNFVVEEEIIKSLLVWIRFPILPIEYIREVATKSR